LAKIWRTPSFARNLAAPTAVDVIWVPKGAWAVRYIGDSDATSLDAAGHTLLINVSRLDESALPNVKACAICPAVFPTLAASLAAGGTSQSFGTDDPRIVWRGKTDAANTTLAAVGDVDTGFLFGGTLLTATVRIQSAIDPRLVVKARLAAGLTTVRSIVPLVFSLTRARLIQPIRTRSWPRSASRPRCPREFPSARCHCGLGEQVRLGL
jgi:hypothetical protein